ncbi:LPXTG cell wall anchor domain-containing protein [Microbacterium sp. dk485]|uniref:thioester domain-containing protein n=1 Tax=Microbacterium sp. dk485 TaxID=2560021 RepID=UPI00107454DC|nr:thioester domain-containing protein [Microbacterium sp. dk485]TFV83674.1 LPXTG cell wall anchor domain-containing protein [Microbacterium sp. dk485]
MATLTVALLALGGAAYAHVPDEGTPIAESPDGPATDIELVSTGSGRSVAGAYPPSVITQDPAAAYPAAPPADYTPHNAFAGLLNAVSVSDPSQTAEVFCIDIRTPTGPGLGYENGTWDESTVPNLGQVTYILNNFYPAVPDAPASATTAGDRAAAVQAAIWYFTDGFVLNADSPVRAATAEVIAATQAAGPLDEPQPPAVSITPSSDVAGAGTLAGPFTVITDAASVTLSVPDGYTMYSDAAGSAVLPNPYTTTSGTQVWVGSDTQAVDETVLSARAVVTVQSGQVYLYDGLSPGITEAQSVILADTAELDATAQATAQFVPAASLTVDKTFAGDGAGEQSAVQLVIDCGDGESRVADIPAGVSTTQTFTFEGIPVGATCVVTEPTTGENPAAAVTTDAPQSVAIPEAGATATVTNTVTRRADVPGVLPARPGVLPATGTETPLPLLWGGLAGLLGGALLVTASRFRRHPPVPPHQ